MKKIIACSVVLCVAPLAAQTNVDWNGNVYSQMKAGALDAAAPAEPPSAALPAPQAAKGPFSPKAVNSVSAFALAEEDLAAVLAHGAPPDGSPLADKLQAVMSQVYYSAGSAAAEAAPKSVRVASWNINDPLDASKIADIAAVFKGDGARFSRTSDKADAELAGIAQTDVYMIQEIPLPAAIAAAAATGYSVVWAPEFIEVGNNAVGRDPGAAQVITGNAILSRYPLSDFKVLRFSRQADWYKEQNRKSLPLPEKVTRGVGKKAFDVDVREKETRAPVPYGGRLALAASAAIPYRFADASGDSIMIVDLHLESAAKPDVRRAQMDEAVAMIGAADKPAVFAGDLNTSGKDGRIQTGGRFVAGQFDTKEKVVETGISVGITAAGAPTGVGEAYDAYKAWQFFHTAGDPTSRLNREHLLFQDVKDELGVAPVNERNGLNVKKYKNTWSTPSPKHVGVAVLDWMFIYDPNGNITASGSKTYEHLVRDSAKKGAKEDDFLSDHFPIGATLALSEPE